MTMSSLLFLVLAAFSNASPNATVAGKFVVEHPTLQNLGFEWPIQGDANRNATVAVQFRAVGESEWRPALPLVRIGGENIYRRRENLDYTAADGFAGSILNLKPGTEYECQFQLTDPDGASGETRHTVRVKTRTEPQPFSGGRKLHVYAPDYEGDAARRPNFTKRAASLLRRSGWVRAGALSGNEGLSRVTRFWSMSDCISPNAGIMSIRR